MSFKDILSQNHIVDSFKKAISSDHLSHAYIFTGQKGTGKSLFAKEFTKALFCKSNNGDSCDTCHNCTRIDNNNNPDIHWIALGKKDKFIKIENIRDMQHYVNLSPVESEYKVFIIKEADRMNEESSNCLLKTLEEPTLNTIIILIASSLASIKETIKSRCQIMRFKPIPTDVIKEQLMNEFDTEIKEAEWISRFSYGSLGNAIERAVVLGSGPEIGPEDLPNRVVGREPRAVSDIPTYREGMNVARIELIQRALSKTQGNRSAAARLLGLQAKYLLRLMRTIRIK